MNGPHCLRFHGLTIDKVARRCPRLLCEHRDTQREQDVSASEAAELLGSAPPDLGITVRLFVEWGLDAKGHLTASLYVVGWSAEERAAWCRSRESQLRIEIERAERELAELGNKTPGWESSSYAGEVA